MPRKTNNYITAERAKALANENTYFQRLYPNRGGYFIVSNATLKINEKTFKTIQPHLKPRT
jgi:hypothetical protein